MAEITKPMALDETLQRVAVATEAIAAASTQPKNGIIFGFRIDGSESDPSEKVTYLKDAIGMTPAHMDYESGVFDYGSWEGAFFMPRSCMVKSDGTRDYYLSESDNTKKEDGTTASDVANTDYDGNAMMEWGQNGKKIWLKIVPSNDKESAEVYIADHKADEGFHDWAFHNRNGESVAHFYTPKYNGSLISDKLRSLSGQQVMKTKTAEQERTYAKANGTLWDIEQFADIQLINMLLILISKSTDHQTAFGQGLNASGNETINDAFRTGVHNDKGLFFGTNNSAASTYENAVKIFGMENWYGFQWRRYIGHILDHGIQKVKLAYGTEDGSSASGFNLTGEGYIPVGITPTGSNGGYIDKMNFTEFGMFSKNASGSATTHYCDGLWFNNGIVGVPLRGGASDGGARVGSFFVYLGGAASGARWDLGASLSCKPLA